MGKPFIINVVSGKGGTGKTLLSAVLAELLGNAGLSVLVVDLDIYVRGLTSLLYFHRKESLQLAEENELTVSDFLVKDRREAIVGYPSNLAVSKYRSFDVLPSVATINERLNYRDLTPDTRDDAILALRGLLDCIPPNYQVILLDSRAGYDELISATHSVSDASLCVEEDDDISRVTADNLVDQLQRDAPTPLFRVTNKARRVSGLEDLDRTLSVTHVGFIPFDMDVMNSFGGPTFWDDIARSLYRAALVRAWNRLESKLRLGMPLRLPVIRALPSERLERRLGRFVYVERVMLVYSVLIAVLGIGYGFVGRQFLEIILRDPVRLTAIVAGVVAAVLSITVVLRRPNQ